MAIEAKDIYDAETLLRKGTGGYNIRDKTGQVYLRKFTNILDDSLDLSKMREIYEKTYRRNNFTFNINGRNYTQTAICIKFSYAYKEFNRLGKDVYIRAGYSLSELVFIDNVAIIENRLVGIKINTPTESSVDMSLLENYFIFEGGIYKQEGTIPTLMTKAQLREYLYKKGFHCDKIKYVRFKRSSGSSRVGKCLFIDQTLYKTFDKWNCCGLKIKDGDEIDLAAFEAYISLPSSSIIGTLCLEPKNFLVIDDYASMFMDKAVGVKYEKGKLIAKEDYFEISNSIFDGESLLDKELFGDKYKNNGMLLLRNRFFKSACFNTNLQQWFAENSITDIKQLNGFTLANKVSDIKIITTRSSIKYVKFASLKQWFDNFDTTFGIVKYEKPTRYFDGRMVQCHYQLLNTLQLSSNDIAELLKPNLDYISAIRDDPDILRYHIKYAHDKITYDPIPLNSKNEIVYKLMGINHKFSKTKLYYDFRNDLVKSMLRNLKQGHLLVNGTYATLLGNGYEMLQHSIGLFNGESILETNTVHCSAFEYDKTILGSRSPHINSGNLLLVKNVPSVVIDKYFNLSAEIVYINAIGENIQQRLNGCDYDSDALLLTDNKILVGVAQQNYNNFLVPTSMVVSKKVKRYYTDKDKADLDIKTSVNKIGEIVNLSQFLNSIMWQRIHDGATVVDCKELYFDICKLAVLSGIEIDRAKKEYELSSATIISSLKKKYNLSEIGKPMFFKMITLENGFEINPKHKYQYFNTPMDYLQRQITSFNFRNNRKQKQKFLSFSEIVRPINLCDAGKLYYNQRDRIIELVFDCKNKLAEIYCGYNNKSLDEKETIASNASIIKQSCICYINELSINETTMFLLLKSLDDSRYKAIVRLIFTTLFGTPNTMFFKMILYDKHKAPTLEENEYGSIQLFDYNFIKINR